MRNPLRVTLFAGALVLVVAAAARAQTLAPPPPPVTPSLFGRGTTTPSDSNLVLTGSMVGAYDDNLMASDTNGVPDPRVQQSGSYGLGATRLAYSKRAKHGEFGASGTSALRYFPTLNHLVGVEHGVSGSGSVHFGGLRLDGATSLDYLPLFAFMNTPRLFDTTVTAVQDAPAVGFDQVALHRQARQLRWSAGATQSLGRNASVSLYGSRDESDFAFESRGLTTQSIGARLSRHLTKYISGIIGLSHQEARYALALGGSQITRAQSIDAGLDYNRPLGRRRRTTLAFTSGLTAIEDAGHTNPYRFIGGARIRRLLGRTWQVTGAFDRGIGFVAGVDRPFFSDAVAVNLSGTLSRRLQLSMAGSYSRGQIGIVTSNNQTQAFSGSSRMHLGLTRHTALTAEYFLYHYMLDVGALSIGIPPSLDRHGARVGIELWVPLVR